MTGHDCSGVRAGPDDVPGGYRTCPGCLIEATATFICFDTEDDTAPTA